MSSTRCCPFYASLRRPAQPSSTHSTVIFEGTAAVVWVFATLENDVMAVNPVFLNSFLFIRYTFIVLFFFFVILYLNGGKWILCN